LEVPLPVLFLDEGGGLIGVPDVPRINLILFSIFCEDTEIFFDPPQ
jgi:hypothetical protein